MMNFVDFVIDCYSYITLHVSQVFASCTHYTSYSLLNLVHYIVCDLVMAIQDYMFLDFDANVFNVWVLETNWLKNLFLEDLGWIQVFFFFEKLLITYSCILFIIYCALRSFCIKLLYFSKIWFFHASFMFRIHMYCIDFLYPSYSFAVLSLIVFTHNMHTLCYIGYSTWLKKLFD